MAFALNRKLWRNLQDYGLRASLDAEARNPVICRLSRRLDSSW